MKVKEQPSPARLVLFAPDQGASAFRVTGTLFLSKPEYVDCFLNIVAVECYIPDLSMKLLMRIGILQGGARNGNIKSFSKI